MKTLVNSRKMAEMMILQDKLNSFLNPEWQSAGNDWGLAIADECMEIINTIGWKWWKHKPEPSLKQLQLEVVDIWHFYLSWGLQQGLAASMLTAPTPEDDLGFKAPPDYSYFLSAAKVMTVAGMEFTFDAAAMHNLLFAARLSFDELYRMYLAKATLNLFRWQNGYGDGSYIKTWDGAEDNVYLEKLLTDDPDMSQEQILSALSLRYKEIKQ